MRIVDTAFRVEMHIAVATECVTVFGLVGSVVGATCSGTGWRRLLLDSTLARNITICSVHRESSIQFAPD